MYKIIKRSTYDAILKEAVVNANEAAKLQKQYEDVTKKLKSSRAYTKELEGEIKQLKKNN